MVQAQNLVTAAPVQNFKTRPVLFEQRDHIRHKLPALREFCRSLSSPRHFSSFLVASRTSPYLDCAEHRLSPLFIRNFFALPSSSLQVSPSPPPPPPPSPTMPRAASGNRPKIHFCQREGCQASFGTKSDRKRHELTHGSRQEFVCSFCSKGFVQKSALTAHLNSHLGRRPHLCPRYGCNDSFPDPSSRGRHYAEIHRGRIYPCPETGCTYHNKRRIGLRQHLEGAHKMSRQAATDLDSGIEPQYMGEQEYRSGNGTIFPNKNYGPRNEDTVEILGEPGPSSSRLRHRRASASTAVVDAPVSLRRNSRTSHFTRTSIPSIDPRSPRPMRAAALAARGHFAGADEMSPITPAMTMSVPTIELEVTPNMRPSEFPFDSVIDTGTFALANSAGDSALGLNVGDYSVVSGHATPKSRAGTPLSTHSHTSSPAPVPFPAISTGQDHLVEIYPGHYMLISSERLHGLQVQAQADEQVQYTARHQSHHQAVPDQFTSFSWTSCSHQPLGFYPNGQAGPSHELLHAPHPQPIPLPGTFNDLQYTGQAQHMSSSYSS
ncbi:hypothetical protein BKA62DRAFT_756203 [Auriculariales sp. MPI-PUGE-AT-0066]|nr:hypothetical protein BKA62DRAFT_756203 [Auriculariales sp. MPI-PUGE-AT-0066]